MKEHSRTREKSFSVDAILVRNPKRVLKEAIEKGNWFEGVVLSKVFLEEYAIDRLRKYLASNNILPRPFLYRMRLLTAARILKELRLIDQKTQSLIGEVNAYRNKLLYDDRSPDAIKPDEAKRIIEKTLKCFEAIVSSYESMKK